MFGALQAFQNCSSPEGARDPHVLPFRREELFCSLDFSRNLCPRSPFTQASQEPPTQFTSSLCPATQEPRGEQQPILSAPKWVDYSSKYGFGYQLSDGGSGVLLRDGTHMALRPPGG